MKITFVIVMMCVAAGMIEALPRGGPKLGPKPGSGDPMIEGERPESGVIGERNGTAPAPEGERKRPGPGGPPKMGGKKPESGIIDDKSGTATAPDGERKRPGPGGPGRMGTMGKISGRPERPRSSPPPTPQQTEAPVTGQA